MKKAFEEPMLDCIQIVSESITSEWDDDVIVPPGMGGGTDSNIENWE